MAIQALPPHHILSKGCTWCWDSSSPSSPFISARCVDSKCGGGHFPWCLFLLQVVAGKCGKPLRVHSPPGWSSELALFPLRLRAPEHCRYSYKLHVEIDGISPGTHVPQCGLEATDRLPFGWCRKIKALPAVGQKRSWPLLVLSAQKRESQGTSQIPISVITYWPEHLHLYLQVENLFDILEQNHPNRMIGLSPRRLFFSEVRYPSLHELWI